MKTKTITAISTPIGLGGISVIRLSGDQSLNICSKVFTSTECEVKNFEPRKMYLGILKTANFSDKCMAVYFKSPNSYTGEDVVEFHCHGGMKLADGVLRELISHGASLAQAGEFTKRAFLNGKVSLDEAEGVIDLIYSETDSQIRAGYNLLQGNLRTKIEELQNLLTDILSKVEVSLDYPDEDLETQTIKDIKSELSYFANELATLYKTSGSGMTIKNGCRIVILGKTNVGKSSIMNALLNFDRAIVTDIEGTTRDLLEESFEYKGVKFIIVDTAGIRYSKDRVEAIGIERAKNSIRYADVVLYVLDANKTLDSEDREMMGFLAGKRVIALLNKCDLPIKVDENKINTRFKNVIKISALQKAGIEDIKETIYNQVIDGEITESSVMLTNTRHIGVILQALEMINVMNQALENYSSMDLIAFDIKQIWLKLGEITGQTDMEAVVDNIFAKFCVGK